MKKIINGKVYDTHTAEFLADWDNGLQLTDFYYFEENLYRKKTGEFFLYGWGHGLSKYATHHGNNSGDGEEIIPMTYDEAREWAEKHLSGEKYCEIFGEPEEDDSKVRVTIYLTSTTAHKVKAEAAKQGVSLSEYVESKLS